MHNVRVQLVVSGFHRWQGQYESAVFALLGMKMINHIKARLPNRVQVHEVAMVRHEIVHLANEDPVGCLLQRLRLHPAGFAHFQR